MKASSIALCIAVIGCGNGGHDPPPAAFDVPSAAASATAAAATPTSTATAGAAPAAPTAGGFNVVAEGDKDMKIYPLGDGAVLDTGAFQTLVGDGPLVQDPEFTKTAGDDPGKPSFSVASRFVDYAGRAPGQLTAREGGEIDFGDWFVFARINGIWAKQSILRKDSNDRHVLQITAWDDGRAIAVVGMGGDMRFALVNSKPGVIVPAPGKPTAEQGEECPVRMDADSLRLAGLPSGHLFAIGSECKTHKAIAERWEPKKVRGEAMLLEGIEAGAHALALAAPSPEEAYALFINGNKRWLATWDGKAWKLGDAPFGNGAALFVAADGSVWGSGESGLFRHPKGGAWTKVELPPGKPTSAWAKDENNVWVVMDDKTLLHKGGPAGKPVKLPPSPQVSSVLERDKRWLATPFCKSIYVMLATIGPNAGKPPASFAPLSDAVRGTPELQKDVTYVVDDNGSSFFAGAKAPSVEVGEKIIAAYKAKNPKSTPMLYCHEPRVAGPLKVD